jgi:hypothetical protein
MSTTYRLDLDPPGYWRVDEPGVHYQATGDTLTALIEGAAEKSRTHFLDRRLWNPAGSPYLVPRPLQMSEPWPDWQMATPKYDIAHYAFRADDFTREAGGYESEMATLPGADAPTGVSALADYVRLILANVADNGDGVMDAHLAELPSALGLPAGLRVVYATTQTPNGEAGSLLACDTHPYMACRVYGNQDACFVWGFHDWCVVVRQTAISLLRWETGAWTAVAEIPADWEAGAERTPFGRPPGRPSILRPREAPHVDHAMMFVPVGQNTLQAVVNGQEHAIAVHTRKPGSQAPFFERGAWWIAGAPKQRLSWHLEVVGYPGAAVHVPATTELPVLLDTGERYQPTVDPVIQIGYLADSETGTVETHGTGAELVATDTPGNQITVSLCDEEDEPWVSDGTHHECRLRLQVQLPNYGGEVPDFVAPHIRHLGVKFPRKLVARANSLLSLTASQWRRIRCRSSYRNPGMGGIEVELVDNGAALLAGAGFDRRSAYPIHLVKSVDGADTVVCRAWAEGAAFQVQHISGATVAASVQNGGFSSSEGWSVGEGWEIADGRAVHTPGGSGSLSQDCLTAGLAYTVTLTVGGMTAGQVVVGNAVLTTNGGHSCAYYAGGSTLSIVASEDFDGWVDNVSAGGSTGIRFYTLSGRDLLARADTKPLYLPQVFDPEDANGTGHAYAVEETLRGCGWDTDDADTYWAFEDPDGSDPWTHLPGLQNVEAGPETVIDSPWAPEWDKPLLDYAVHVGADFRGWVLYPRLNGLVYYHPDLALAMALGEPYYVAGTLYQSRVNAAAAGAHAGQVWTAAGDRDIHGPRANAVRLITDQAEGSVLHVLDKKTASVTDITQDHYLGDWRVHVARLKGAVTPEAARTMARLILLRECRVVETLPVLSYRAAWDMGLDVGVVAALEPMGNYLIVDCEVELLTLTLHRTRFGLERVPLGATSNPAEGGYPGQGLVVYTSVDSG